MKKGEFFAFLDANGAGKTTTISILTRKYHAKAQSRTIFNSYNFGFVRFFFKIKKVCTVKYLWDNIIMMRIKYFRVSVILAVNLLCVSCVTEFNMSKVTFSPENRQCMRRLHYYNQSNINFSQAETIVSSVFQDMSAEWGYYYIKYTIQKSEQSFFDWGIVDGAVATIANIFGVPKSIKVFNLIGTIYIFDSHGDIVGLYENSNSTKQYSGFYYGYKVPHEKIEKIYKDIFNEILNTIVKDSDEINRQLDRAGTIKEENAAQVYTKIYQILK